MIGASLVICALLGQGAAADPAALVARLGAPRYADREAASRALEDLGRQALPALRQARDAKDPEVRTRAAGLVVRIEGALLTKPTLVRLDFENAGLTDVLRSITEQTGIKMTLIPAPESPTWRLRRVTLREPEPLPFWTAIDRLCDAAQLQYNYGTHHPAGREPTFPLFDGAGRSAMPLSDSGPFRVSVVRLHFQSDVSFPTLPRPNPAAPRMVSPGQPGHTRSEQLFAQLQVTGEPRLTLAQAGPVKLSEAVDDKGQALVAPAGPGESLNTRMSGYFGFSGSSAVQVQAGLTRPQEPGTMIRRLKGVVPVLVSTRKPDPLTIPLTGEKDKVFENDDVSISIHEVRDQDNARPGSVELTIRPAADAAGPAGFGAGMPLRPDTYQHQIDVVDARGQLLPWFQTSFDAETGRLTMTFPSHEQGKAAEIRYYGLVQATSEVPFEFHDLPMP